MNIAVAQSGGPTVAINASLCGVIKGGLENSEIDKIYGSQNGIEGIINDRLVVLSDDFSDPQNLQLLKNTPSTALGSCRYKMPSISDGAEVYEKILNRFLDYNITMFFYIGGNDSMDTVDKLSAYFSAKNQDIKVIGIPKTIDNDLCETDHTPGFGSASKYLTTTMSEIICDSSVYSAPSVTIIEVMGRHAGWLTASSCLLHRDGEVAPHLIYLPEREFSVAQFIADVMEIQAKHKAVIVAVSEGIMVSDPKYNTSDFQSGAVDSFGHKYLSGIGKCLERIVKQEIKCKVRSIELNVCQRCASHIASKTDLDEAEAIGTAAIGTAISGKTGVMMTIIRESNSPYTYRFDSAPASEIANKEKRFPDKWINCKGNNINSEAKDYFSPLIQGEVEILYKDGLPVHVKI